MKIFAGGILTETNTFSPVPTGYDDFQVQRGKDPTHVESRSLDPSSVWKDRAESHGHEFLRSLMAFAQPSGVTVRSAYEALRDELLKDLRAALPVDVVLLNLHGAMVAQGYDDCEEDIIRRVRALVGPGTIIGVELDLHCHLSHTKIAAADVVLTYKEYPHYDVNDRARELFDLAVRAKAGDVRPKMALFDCRMIGLYATTREPLRSLVNVMKATEGRAGVLSVSFGHGFQFADVPNVGAKMLVVTDNDSALAERIARDLGTRAHAMRRKIGFESFALSLDDALNRAFESNNYPVIVADQSDNPGGGAPGDATFALRWLLEHEAEEAAIALLYDPEVVSIAKKVGPGVAFQARVGGKLGVASGQPVDIGVTVLASRDDYWHGFPQQSGHDLWFRAGDVAALRCGSIDIVVSSERCQCFSPSIFFDLGIDFASKRTVIVKSTQHFYGAFAPMASEIIYMGGPGAVVPDPRVNSYRRLDTGNLYPWVQNPILATTSGNEAAT